MNPIPSTLQQAASSGLIQSGDIVHSFTDLWFPRRIKQALGSWGSHDAIIVRPESDLYIGDSIHPRATCTPLAEYDAKIASGLTQGIVLRPTGSTELHGSIAAAWWLSNVLGKPYDWGSFPRLMLKCLVGDRCQWPAGWEWAWYCTEGVRDAWRNGPNLDPWAKTNPTPRTTEKRFESGAFTLIWSSPNQAPSTPPQADAPVRHRRTGGAQEPSSFPLTTPKLTTQPERILP